VIEVITDLLFVQFNQKYCFASAKELMRLNGIMKSPVAHHFCGSIARAMTIGAFMVEDQFLKKNLDILDLNSSPSSTVS